MNISITRILTFFGCISSFLFFVAAPSAYADTNCVVFGTKELPYTEASDTNREYPFQIKMCFERDISRKNYVINYSIAPYDLSGQKVVGPYKSLVSNVKYEVTGRARCLCDLGDMVETKDSRVVGSNDFGLLEKFSFDGGSYESGTVSFVYNNDIYKIPYTKTQK